jgi:hypothetical protein
MNTQPFIDSLKLRHKLGHTAAHRRRPFIPVAKQYLRQRLRALRLCIQNRTPVSLPELPVDVLLLIFPLLPLLLQVCLALTCKSLYELFGHVLSDESLAWPRQFASKDYMPLVYQSDLPRNQLIFMLEDDYWIYCSLCLKLHPQSRFERGRRSFPLYLRWCKNGKGVLDISPCLSLTFDERDRLEQCLRAGLLDPGMPRSSRHAFRLSVDHRGRHLIHECSIDDHANAFITIRVTISLADQDDLLLQTRYHIYLTRSRPAPAADDDIWLDSLCPFFAMEPVLSCAHFDVLESLYRPDNASRGCGRCGTTIIETGGTTDGLHVVVECARDIGGAVGLRNWRLGSRNHHDTLHRTWYRHHGADTWLYEVSMAC